MKKPSYKNTYLSLVKKVNLDKIKHILNESGYYNEDIVEQIEYEEKDNFSYFSLTVDSSELLRQGAYALLDGVFVEINSIVQQWNGVFYLPIMIIREVINEKLKSFVSPETIKEHELHHLQHIIEHIDKCPNYIENSMRYNVGSCPYADIEKSIEFEVNKLFSFELPAITADFEKGERDYYLYSDGLISMTTSHDKNEFIQYNLAQYIVELRLTYIDRFGEKETEITDFIAKEVNKQGKKIFGENTMTRISMVLLKFMILAKNHGKHFEIED